jgi:IstB-like ATP binding protein
VCKAHGDRDGTKALIEVLLLHRHLPHGQVAADLAAALHSGALTADAVALEARRFADVNLAPKPADPSPTAHPRTYLTEQRLAHLPPDIRPLPSVTRYDQLLRLRPTAQKANPSDGAEHAPTRQPHRTGRRCGRRPGLPHAAATTIRGQFPDLTDQAAREQMSYRGFVAELLMAECDERARRRAERRIKAAAFPRPKALREFDFDANQNVDPAMIHTLARCEWIKKGMPLCLIGDSGTGKSHLLIALGTEAAMSGFRDRDQWESRLLRTSAWSPLY